MLRINPELLDKTPTHFLNGELVNLKESTSTSAEILTGEHKGKYTTLSNEALPLTTVEQLMAAWKHVASVLSFYNAAESSWRGETTARNRASYEYELINELREERKLSKPAGYLV